MRRIELAEALRLPKPREDAAPPTARGVVPLGFFSTFAPASASSFMRRQYGRPPPTLIFRRQPGNTAPADCAWERAVPLRLLSPVTVMSSVTAIQPTPRKPGTWKAISAFSVSSITTVPRRPAPIDRRPPPPTVPRRPPPTVPRRPASPCCAAAGDGAATGARFLRSLDDFSTSTWIQPP